MPKHERPDFESESMEAIRRSDSFIDALAGGRPAPAQDAADAELAALLGRWRDEMRWPPATGLITEDEAVAALNAGKAQKRLGPVRDRWTVDTEITSRKNRRGMSVIGAAAAAVLCIGGFGAVVAGAGPGDGLYGLRTMLFGTPKEVRDDQVGLAAKTTLNQVQDLIAQGDWSQAQNKLVEVSSQVASIGDQEQKQVLLDQFNDLSAKVVERDPAATAPPGVVYTVPPSAAELVPALVPPGDSTTSTTSSSTATTTTTTATTPATSTTPETSAAPTTSSAPTSATPSVSSTATSSVEASTSSAPTVQSEQTTTPTSAAPASAAESPSAAVTTAAPTTAVPETSPAAPVSTTAAVTTAAPAEAATTPAEDAPAETAAPETAAVITTELVPVPVG